MSLVVVLSTNPNAVSSLRKRVEKAIKTMLGMAHISIVAGTCPQNPKQLEKIYTETLGPIYDVIHPMNALALGAPVFCITEAFEKDPENCDWRLVPVFVAVARTPETDATLEAAA